MTNEKPLKMNESQGEELVERDDDAIEILDTDTPTVPFKFSKKATTDDIVNIDADLIDMDSFHYLNKHSQLFCPEKVLIKLYRKLLTLVASGMEFVNKTSALIQTQYVRTQIYSVNRLYN